MEQADLDHNRAKHMLISKGDVEGSDEDLLSLDEQAQRLHPSAKPTTMNRSGAYAFSLQVPLYVFHKILRHVHCVSLVSPLPVFPEIQKHSIWRFCTHCQS